jgi:hypothetical protein
VIHILKFIGLVTDILFMTFAVTVVVVAAVTPVACAIKVL